MYQIISAVLEPFGTGPSLHWAYSCKQKGGHDKRTRRSHHCIRTLRCCNMENGSKLGLLHQAMKLLGGKTL